MYIIYILNILIILDILIILYSIKITSNFIISSVFNHFYPPIKKQTIKEMTKQFIDILYENPRNMYAIDALFYVIENVYRDPTTEIDDYTLYDILNVLLFCCHMYSDIYERSVIFRRIIDVYYKCRLPIIKELKIYKSSYNDYRIFIHICYKDGEKCYRSSMENHIINYDTSKYIIDTWHHYKMTYYFYNKSKIKQVLPINIHKSLLYDCPYQNKIANFGLVSEFYNLKNFEKLFI